VYPSGIRKRDERCVEFWALMRSHHTKLINRTTVRAPTKTRVGRLAASGKIHLCLWFTGCLKLTTAEYTVAKSKKAMARYGNIIGVMAINLVRA
jgi:hypothetical protein